MIHPVRYRAADAREIVTLLEVGEYIAALPKRERSAPEWHAAMEALILVAEGGGPTMFQRLVAPALLSCEDMRRWRVNQFKGGDSRRFR